jgi:hypothetical protein
VDEGGEFEEVMSYVSDNIGCGENATEVIDDEPGVALWVEEWRRYKEGSSPSS